MSGFDILLQAAADRQSHADNNIVGGTEEVVLTCKKSIVSSLFTSFESKSRLR